ncbi:RNA-dependent RNA polymerase, putative [Ixodes scapularis]|uniref:RNA-dependent RNA polymerase n=1 Tax=Ixodes scapularis TaxID=6945 RepID=B7Q2B5_IXOSC|nr:RNA-dependent RNA polymerase, putative [Ixodes scapularis]|eukprot:XP_002410661.1 RNA-dependent RNA polymerase, putative [Ixodes scapularis]
MMKFNICYGFLGSDLDGDEYIVIWEPDLFFPGSNKTPMTFSDSSSVGSADENLEEGMIKFICNYIINDNVGIMSNAHLAWSDQLEDGIFSPLCLGVAKKISTCVDFAKTGLASCLDRHEKPLLYPDFMEKGGSKDTYRSKRVLGHLYRLHRSLQAVINTDFMARTGQLAEGDGHCTLFEYPGWKDHQEVAEKALAAYTVQMSRILHQYGVGSEGEVVSGIIVNVSDYNKSNEDKNSVKALVAKQYASLMKLTRDTFFSDVTAACNSNGASTDIAKKTILLQMASAWYMVTYAGVWHEQNCQSFPWPGFRSMVEQNEEVVARLFKDWSGVLEVSIRKQVNVSGRYLHILVSAVGRDWQLWYLEELLLQPWIGEAVEKGDLEPFLSA